MLCSITASALLREVTDAPVKMLPPLQEGLCWGSQREAVALGLLILALQGDCRLEEGAPSPQRELLQAVIN